MKRRICWPDPDATCLEGGCLYCNDNPFKSVEVIREWAAQKGEVPNRSKGSQLAITAFNRGEKSFWNNAEVK